MKGQLILSLGLMIFFFFGCNSVSEKDRLPYELHGHWHFIKKSNERVNIIDDYLSIDFEDSSLVILGKYQQYPLGGYNDLNEKKIFMGECLSFSMKYDRISPDTIKFRTDDNKEYIAFRCDDGCCNKVDEYFYAESVIVDLPINTKKECQKRYTKGLEHEIFFGKLKTPDGSSETEDPVLILGGVVSELSDLDLWEEQQKMKLPENSHKDIINVIYADKNTQMDKIEMLRVRYLKKGIKNVYLALRKDVENSGLVLCLQKLELGKKIKFTTGQKLASWIKMN